MKKVMQNNCDGSGPHASGEVRMLPAGGDGNMILLRDINGNTVTA